jgi:shikimate kinase
MGKGASLGVDLWTKAKVKLTGESRVVRGRILSEPDENTTLIKETVLATLRHFDVEDRFGAVVETDSNIPIAKGLKSSSAASNALVLAVIGALGEEIDYVEAIKIGVDASINAKTTITGAFDDASASFLGGIVVTDNFNRKILRRFEIEEDLKVIFHIPHHKSYTYESNVKRMRLIAPQVEVAHHEALSGNFWTALTMNGILYSAVLGYEPDVAIEALEAGAIASGLTGKGPATVAVATTSTVERVLEVWRPYGGTIIVANINHEKARVVRCE